MESTASVGRGSGWRQAIGLMILSPICAEYIIGYDTNTGDLPVLVASLLIFSPLYGGPAVLIREMSRRFGLGWPGILTLSAAFGILQAGIIDQSMFSESYREIDYWDTIVGPTWIGPLGLSASASLQFVVGHMIWSFGIPIALVEALSPKTADRPWLRWPGLSVVTLLYLAAAALLLVEHLRTETDHASMAQVIGSIVVVALLVVFAFAACRERPGDRGLAVPGPLAVGVLGLAAGMAEEFMPETWPGVAGRVAILTVAGLGVALASRSARWGPRHVVALATGVLLTRAVFAFLIEPLGDVSTPAKYGHNVTLLVGTLLLGWWAMRRNRPGPDDGREPRGPTGE
jgi:uncharacterized membrane protein